MRNACGNTPQSREPFRHLQLRTNALERFQIAQRNEHSHACPVFLDGLDARAHAPRPVFARDFHFHRLDSLGRNLAVSSDVQGKREWVAGREYFLDLSAKQIFRIHINEFLRRRTYEHRAPLRIEQ